MLKELTTEERYFAETNHNRVITFLNVRHLPHDEYYDVVVFGFLKAVVRYLADADLRARYKFSTIANRKMKDALYSDHRYRNRLKRRGNALSLDYVNDSGYTLYAETATPNAPLDMLKTREILAELSEQLTPVESNVIQLRVQGYPPWEISRELKMSPTQVQELIRNTRDTVYAACA